MNIVFQSFSSYKRQYIRDKIVLDYMSNWVKDARLEKYHDVDKPSYHTKMYLSDSWTISLCCILFFKY